MNVTGMSGTLIGSGCTGSFGLGTEESNDLSSCVFIGGGLHSVCPFAFRRAVGFCANNAKGPSVGMLIQGFDFDEGRQDGIV